MHADFPSPSISHPIETLTPLPLLQFPPTTSAFSSPEPAINTYHNTTLASQTNYLLQLYAKKFSLLFSWQYSLQAFWMLQW